MGMEFNLPPTVPIIWNVEGEASNKTEDELRDVLVDQVVKPVKWSQTMDFCINHSNNIFVELGNGGVLTGLLKQNAPSTTARYIYPVKSHNIHDKFCCTQACWNRRINPKFCG
jgi:malonyl CoA-acyl carrier protein transacylase